MMARLLFLTGESGSGKSTVGHLLESHSTLLHADLITKRAGKHYFPGRKDNFCRWGIWAKELDDAAKHDELFDSFEFSMDARNGAPIRPGSNVLVEGAIVGHPVFRALIRRVLEKQIPFEFLNTDTACFWLNPTPEDVFRNVKKRGRQQEKNVSLDVVRRRAAVYSKMMGNQDVISFQSSANCTTAGLAFLSDC